MTSPHQKPLIGITATPITGSDGLPYARLRMTYVRAVELAGGLPLIIPPVDALEPLLERLDGLLLPGGADVDPAHYGQAPHPTTEVNHALDQLELAAARWAVHSSVPALGICRGQQVLNVACGGSLIQDVPEHPHSTVRTAYGHTVRVEPSSRLAALFGATQLQVNSLHHQALDALGNGLEAVAWAPDGNIEGIESTQHPWLLAVQFHPEDLVDSHEQSRRLLESFVEACRNRKAAAAPALR